MGCCLPHYQYIITTYSCVLFWKMIYGLLFASLLVIYYYLLPPLFKLLRMQGPYTLKEYLQRITLQRKNEFMLLNQAKNIPNPINLDKSKKIDALIIDILDYIKNLIGDGPLYSRFQIMMDNLHKTFSRELSQFHQVAVYNKLHHDGKHIEQIRRANEKLSQYVKQCEKEKEEADLKLQKLVTHNKANRLIEKNRHEKQIIDNFDSQDVVEKVTRVQKIPKFEIISNNTVTSPKNTITGSKSQSNFMRKFSKLQTKL